MGGDDLRAIDDAVAAIRAAHELGAVRARSAWVCAPFGQPHVDACAANLRRARALRIAAEQGELSVLVFTSTELNVASMPAWVRVVRVGPIAHWPTPDAYQNRFVKWALPFLLPNVEASIYADGDLLVVGDGAWLRATFERVRERELLLTAHVRRGWTDELAAILATPRFLLPERLARQRAAYESEGLPPIGPMYQNNFVGRRHGSRFDTISAIVLEQVHRFSHRDQLALPYALWKAGLTVHAPETGVVLLTTFYRRGFERASCGLVDPRALGLYLRLRWTGELLSGTRFAPRVERVMSKLQQLASAAHPDA